MGRRDECQLSVALFAIDEELIVLEFLHLDGGLGIAGVADVELQQMKRVACGGCRSHNPRIVNTLPGPHKIDRRINEFAYFETVALGTDAVDHDGSLDQIGTRIAEVGHADIVRNGLMDRKHSQQKSWQCASGTSNDASQLAFLVILSDVHNSV